MDFVDANSFTNSHKESRTDKSWQVANKTPEFRARTAEWDKTSTELGVSKATAPKGISSSPPTLSQTKMVGSRKLSFMISRSVG